MTETLEIEVAGNLYKNFTSAEVMIGMDSLSRTFGFGATSDSPNPLPFFRGQPCTIKADNELVLTGTIEIINVSGSAEEHTIDIQGRDRTGDLLDSSLGNIGDFSATVSLSTLAKAVLKHLGIDIKVIDTLDLDLFDKAEDQITPDVGEGAFDYLQKWARKRSVLLASDPEGNLLFTQPEEATDTTETVYIRHRADDIQNNVINYNATFDSTGRYNRYIVTSQGNPVLFNKAGNRSNPTLTDQTGGAIEDKDVRRGRQLVLIAETAASVGENTTRAEWEANVRSVRGQTYSCTVRGYRNQNGDLWTPGELAFVDDVFAGISAEMRINTVIFSMGPDGVLTQLTLLKPNAYKLTLGEPKEQNVGVGFQIGGPLFIGPPAPLEEE